MEFRHEHLKCHCCSFWTTYVKNSLRSFSTKKNYYQYYNFAKSVDKKEEALFWKRKIDEYWKAREKARLEFR